MIENPSIFDICQEYLIYIKNKLYKNTFTLYSIRLLLLNIYTNRGSDYFQDTLDLYYQPLYSHGYS